MNAANNFVLSHDRRSSISSILVHVTVGLRPTTDSSSIAETDYIAARDRQLELNETEPTRVGAVFVAREPVIEFFFSF